MYALKLNEDEKKAFIKLVRVRMIEQDLSVKDIADLTGYSTAAIYKLFNGYDEGRFMAAALAEQLNIKQGEWGCYM